MTKQSAANDDFARAAHKPTQIDTVVIPVAGKGTRLLPTTKAIPKHFQEISGISLIQHAVDEGKKAGAKHFVFIVDDDPLSRALIERHFLPHAPLNDYLHEKGKDDKLAELEEIEMQPDQISFVVQKEQNGLWGAVTEARDKIVGDTFAVITPDDLVLPDTAGLLDLARHHPQGGISFSVEKVSLADAHKFGIVDFSSQDKDGAYKVTGVTEKPAPGKETSTTVPGEDPFSMAIAGRYILPTKLFDQYQPAEPASVTNEISIAHAINAVAGQMPVRAHVVSGTKFDCGDRIGLAKATMYEYEHDPVIGPALRQQWAAAAQPPKAHHHRLRAVSQSIRSSLTVLRAGR